MHGQEDLSGSMRTGSYIVLCPPSSCMHAWLFVACKSTGWEGLCSCREGGSCCRGTDQVLVMVCVLVYGRLLMSTCCSSQRVVLAAMQLQLWRVRLLA